MVKGGMRGEGGHAWQKGACMAKGGMRDEGGHVWQRGGMCGMHTPTQYTASHCMGGTHPTGMHSCYYYKL